jgi:hypothetical protein
MVKGPAIAVGPVLTRAAEAIPGAVDRERLMAAPSISGAPPGEGPPSWLRAARERIRAAIRGYRAAWRVRSPVPSRLRVPSIRAEQEPKISVRRTRKRKYLVFIATVYRILRKKTYPRRRMPQGPPPFPQPFFFFRVKI